MTFSHSSLAKVFAATKTANTDSSPLLMMASHRQEASSFGNESIAMFQTSISPTVKSQDFCVELQIDASTLIISSIAQGIFQTLSE